MQLTNEETLQILGGLYAKILASSNTNEVVLAKATNSPVEYEYKPLKSKSVTIAISTSMVLSISMIMHRL